MSAIHDLIGQIQDAALRERIAAEVERVVGEKKFGLVFEDHIPESTPLYDVPVRRGTSVALRNGDLKEVWRVARVAGGVASCFKEGEGEAPVLRDFPVSDLVAVARFGEAIYPYLKPMGEVRHAPESDLWHTLIEADNYHALQFLEYLYAGQVDCIYIDPPYNAGAKDWKYNNDYVDGNDAYRHSKWLSMMQKRLKLAKKLLNPKDSVLIVTIDEKEYLHLGCLLEEIFPEARIEMVTSIISAKGVVRPGQFARVEEHVFFVCFGVAGVSNQAINMLDQEVKKESDREIEWLGLRRREPTARRGARPRQFYPVFVRAENGYIDSVGDAVVDGINRESISIPDGCVAIWPLRGDGNEGLWGLTPDVLRANWKKGYVRVKNWNPQTQTGTLYYLPGGTIDDIESGRAVVAGRNEDGSIIATYVETGTVPPKRVWNLKSHNAEVYGTDIVAKCIGKGQFTFPKSLYAVHDALRFFVENKPNALIVDFFAGSGTTLHAVNLLNAEDGGHRRCIMVTNNEVSESEAAALSRQGFKPGDEEWETLGIARHVTWPRTVCSIEGHNVAGEPLSGNYGVEVEDYEVDEEDAVVSRATGRPTRTKIYRKTKRELYPKLAEMRMADGFKANAAFFKLGFLDKSAVSLGRQFREMLPTLWMKAGAHGPCPAVRGEPGEMLVLPENRFAVLLEERAFGAFRERVAGSPEISSVYLVTDYELSFRSMAAAFRDRKTVQLYRDYLDSFRINRERN